MGYCVRRLRELNLVKHGARFASLIDDGALRLLIPSDNFEARLDRVLKIIEKIYAMASLYISWDKTFVSGMLCVFLNEVRFGGISVTPGLRAYLKISNVADDVAPSLPSDLAHLQSTVRGALAAGCNVVSAYGAYVYNVMDLCKRWKVDTGVQMETFAVRAFTPLALGGLGMLTSLDLSNAVEENALVAGIGCLKRILGRFPRMSVYVNRVLNQKIRPASKEALLRNPGSFRLDGPILRSDRLNICVERHLLKTHKTGLLGRIIAAAGGDEVPIIAHLTANQVQSRLLPDVLALLVSNYIDKLVLKFMRAGTVVNFVPRRMFVRVKYANKADVKRTFR
jgi:hypothetical protein